MTNCFKPINEIQKMIDSLREKGYNCEITNYGWNGQYAVTFWESGTGKGSGLRIVHKNLRHAVLKAIETIKAQKTTR